jgi:hypothetical protein
MERHHRTLNVSHVYKMMVCAAGQTMPQACSASIGLIAFQTCSQRTMVSLHEQDEMNSADD